jgi:hypothetical protein
MRPVATLNGGVLCALAVALAGCGDEAKLASSPTPAVTPTATAETGGYRPISRVDRPRLRFAIEPTRQPRCLNGPDHDRALDPPSSPFACSKYV